MLLEKEAPADALRYFTKAANAGKREAILPAAELAADFRRIRRRAPVGGDARRQQVEARGRGAVVLFEQRLLQGRDHQDFGSTARLEHRALEGGEMPVAAGIALPPPTPAFRTLIAGNVVAPA